MQTKTKRSIIWVLIVGGALALALAVSQAAGDDPDDDHPDDGCGMSPSADAPPPAEL